MGIHFVVIDLSVILTHDNYWKNWKLSIASDSHYCVYCNSKIVSDEKIYHNHQNGKTLHQYCFKQPFKKFRTKFANKCIVCKKWIKRGLYSYYNVEDHNLTCINCIDIKKSKFECEINDCDLKLQKIINFLKEKFKINLKLIYSQNSEENYSLYYDSDNSFSITLNGDLEIIPIFFHELAHVLFTDFKSNKSSKIFDDISLVYSQKLGREMKFSEKSFLQKKFHSTWNIVEDIRIEEKISKSIPFLKNHFINLRKISGNRWDDDLLMYESDMLLAKRFFRDDLIPRKYRSKITQIYNKSCKSNSSLEISKNLLCSGNEFQSNLDEFKYGKFEDKTDISMIEGLLEEIRKSSN